MLGLKFNDVSKMCPLAQTNTAVWCRKSFPMNIDVIYCYVFHVVIISDWL